MKPRPDADYHIKLFLHSTENWGHTSQFYQGIYGLRLNHSVKLCLCPSYDTAIYGFPTNLDCLSYLEDVGNIQSTDEARALSVVNGGTLVLLENDDHAGQLIRATYPEGHDPDLPSLPIPVMESHYIYCLTHAEYVQYAAELEAIMHREFNSTVWEEEPFYYNKLSNLRSFCVIAHIHKLLSTHPEMLSKYEREMLVL